MANLSPPRGGCVLTILPPSSERNPIGTGLAAPPQTAAIRQRHAELRQLREEREHLVEQVRRLQGLGQGPHGPGEVTIPGGDNSPGGGGVHFCQPLPACVPNCGFFFEGKDRLLRATTFLTKSPG